MSAPACAAENGWLGASGAAWLDDVAAIGSASATTAAAHPFLKVIIVLTPSPYRSLWIVKPRGMRGSIQRTVMFVWIQALLGRFPDLEHAGCATAICAPAIRFDSKGCAAKSIARPATPADANRLTPYCRTCSKLNIAAATVIMTMRISVARQDPVSTATGFWDGARRSCFGSCGRSAHWR